MTAIDKKFLYIFIGTTLGAYVLFGLYLGGWKHISVFWSPVMLLFLGHLIMSQAQNSVVTVRIRNERDSLLAYVDYAVHFGLYFAIFMALLFFSSEDGAFSSVRFIIGGAVFGGLMSFMRYRSRSKTEPMAHSNFVNIEQPASKNKLGAFFYYALPLFGLVVFAIGLSYFELEWVRWMGVLIIFSSLLPYYPYRFDLEIPSFLKFLLAPTILGLAFVFIAIRMAG